MPPAWARSRWVVPRKRGCRGPRSPRPWALLVQNCATGRRSLVSSRVPARRLSIGAPSLWVQIRLAHVPQLQEKCLPPAGRARSVRCGDPATTSTAPAGTTSDMLKALPVRFWQRGSGRCRRSGAAQQVADFAAVAAPARIVPFAHSSTMLGSASQASAGSRLDLQASWAGSRTPGVASLFAPTGTRR
jgi:hypothetical protein